MILTKSFAKFVVFLVASLVLLLLKACNLSPPTVANVEIEHNLAPTEISLQTSDLSQEGYQIVLNFISPLSNSQRNVFENAARRWEQIVTGDLPTVFVEANGLFIDDLLIDVITVIIDGQGGVLGEAGPRALRITSGLPAAGVMEFDIDDLQKLETEGQLEKVILHEMLHVLGFGTIWRRNEFNLSRGIFYPRYIGEQARSIYQSVFSLSPFFGLSIPLETDGGPGIRGQHWSESLFGNELMTGFIDEGFSPISSVTIASLVDLGYEVDFSQAEDFSPLGRNRTTSEPLGHCRVLNDLPIDWVKEL
ncbi:MAG: peptidase [Synechococcaceae cyanobacterium SM2_3_1]|nr:peptidase [Synechococcaceae cyanobacterium SM2_3_1]